MDGMVMALDTFLICRNCINWGQPWILGKKQIICEQKQDVEGTLYTSQHPACKYFVPIQGKLPEGLQRMRLFVQTLSPSQQSHFAWSLAQASLLLKARDATGQRLALGDQVTFRLGLFGHTGTIEGANPQHKHAVIINCPAFVNSSISLLASSVTKITKEQAKEIIGECSSDDKQKLAWHIDCLVKEISLLRTRQEQWTRTEHLAATLYEQQLQSLELRLRQNAIQSLI
jgi:hypothetical protein